MAFGPLLHTAPVTNKQARWPRPHSTACRAPAGRHPGSPSDSQAPSQGTWSASMRGCSARTAWRCASHTPGAGKGGDADMCFCLFCVSLFLEKFVFPFSFFLLFFFPQRFFDFSAKRKFFRKILYFGPHFSPETKHFCQFFSFFWPIICRLLESACSQNLFKRFHNVGA